MFRRTIFLVCLLLPALGAFAIAYAQDDPFYSATETGEIDAARSFFEFPVTVAQDGSTVVLDMRPVNAESDLDTYLYLVDEGGNIVAENDDRARDDFSSRLEFLQADAATYTAIATRYGVTQGTSTGAFTLDIEVLPPADSGVVFAVDDAALTAAGFPDREAFPPREIADWTVLAYYGGDNNLEYALQYDLNEFELAGGSDDTVRVIALFDRHPEHSEDNGDWRSIRIFEISADVTGDHEDVYPPTLDTVEPIADLGAIDTGSGEMLAQFMVWAIDRYPAQNYAVAMASHGAGWRGIITDDTASANDPQVPYSIMSVPELARAFDLATETAGVEQFAMLINDACLMSSVEYFAGLAPYFDLSLASPEIVVDPALDMERFVNALRAEPGTVDLRMLGTDLVDQYVLEDMRLTGDTDVEYFNHALTDLNNFDPVTATLADFAAYVNTDPAFFADVIGSARANTYEYTAFAGSTTRIDLGSFMTLLIEEIDTLSGVVLPSEQPRYTELGVQASAVLAALDAAILYENAGANIGPDLSYYNIYFPASSARFEIDYFIESPLVEWGRMLRNYYNAVTPQVWTGGTADVPFHETQPPRIKLTSRYPQGDISVVNPITFGFELVGRNVAYVDATYDRVESDGSVVRLSTERIPLILQDEETGETVRRNIWYEGVDVRNFFWDVSLPVVTDGESAFNELLIFAEDVAYLEGQYREPGSTTWNEVSIVFDRADDNAAGVGRVQRVINRARGSSALAVIDIPTGSEFVAFRALVSPDGRVISERGSAYTWPEGGLTYTFDPAPSGEYQIGLLAEAFGGTTGFDSQRVTVDNDAIPDADLRADTRLNEGFTLTRPKSWSFLVIDNSIFAFRTRSFEGDRNMTVYIAIEENPDGDLEAVVDEVFAFYFPETTWDRQYEAATVGGRDAITFDFSYATEPGDVDARAFAVYLPEAGLGYVFTAEAESGVDLDAIYTQMVENVAFFDPALADEGSAATWDLSYFSFAGREPFTPEVEYPIPRTWQPMMANDWTIYRENTEAETFFAVSIVDAVDSESALDDAAAQIDAGAVTVIADRSLTTDYHTWAARLYTVEREGAVYQGRIYATIANEQAYRIWMETPADDAASSFSTIFEPIVDGYIISPIVEDNAG